MIYFNEEVPVDTDVLAVVFDVEDVHVVSVLNDKSGYFYLISLVGSPDASTSRTNTTS